MKKTKTLVPIPGQIGMMLGKKYGLKALSQAVATTEWIYGKAQTAIATLDQMIADLERKEQAKTNELTTEMRNKGLQTEEGAKSGRRWGWFFTVMVLPLKSVAMVLLFRAIELSHYGRTYLAVIYSVGAALGLMYGLHIVLEWIRKKLTNQQMQTFVVAITLTMVLCGFLGFMNFSRARALRDEVRMAESLMDIDPDTLIEIENKRKQIDKYNSRAMILTFCGNEWIAAIFLFLAFKSLRRNNPAVKLINERDAYHADAQNAKTEKIRCEGMTKERIHGELVLGINYVNQQGSRWLPILAVAGILGMIVFFLVGDAFGKFLKYNYSCLPFDVTGSTKRERLMAERTAVKIIDSMQPGDAFTITLITEKSFSDPEFVVEGEMPLQSGHFPIEVVRRKIKHIAEFRKKAETLSEERCATKLVEGMYRFAKMCQEQRNKKKHLIILSDMIQHSDYLDEQGIAQDPNAAFLKVKNDGYVPDMTSVNVYVFGATTTNLTQKEHRSLEIFWRKFFSEAKATLLCYDMGWHWPFEE